MILGFEYPLNYLRWKKKAKEEDKTPLQNQKPRARQARSTLPFQAPVTGSPCTERHRAAKVSLGYCYHCLAQEVEILLPPYPRGRRLTSEGPDAYNNRVSTEKEQMFFKLKEGNKSHGTYRGILPPTYP